MTYTPYHSDWKDYPDTTTPVTGAALEYIETGITSAQDRADAAYSLGGGSDPSLSYFLSASTSVGGTSITVDHDAVSPLVVGSIVLLSAYTTRAELKSVTAVSGGTLTVSAMNTAHTADDTVLVLTTGRVTPRMFGCLADGSDDWGPLQRCVLEAVALSMKIDGLEATYYIGKPLLVPTSSYMERVTIQSRTGFSPVQAAGAMVMIGNAARACTAAASTNTFTTTSSHGMNSYSETNDSKTVVVNPYGETLPGGVTAGGVYYIDTVPSNTTFTLSATAGGAILDVTSDGAGWVFTLVGDLCRMYWDSPRLNLTVSDLNGLISGLQQPSYTRDMRIEMSAAATTAETTTGWFLSGQLSYHDNVEIDTTTNCTGMNVSGSGHVIRGFNDNGDLDDDIGMTVTGRCITVNDIWTEQCGRAGIQLTGLCRGIDIGGTWLYSNASPTTSPALLVTTTTTSYRVNQIRTANSGTLLLNDTGRSITVYAWDGGTAGDTDTGLVYHGHTQWYGSVGPKFLIEAYNSVSADYTVTRISRYVMCDPSAANRTVTLPTAVGWGGSLHTIVHSSGSANTVSVEQTGTETINGSTAAVVLNSYEHLTVLSNGANWIRVE